MPSFNFYGCPDEEENQLAHYHPDSNTICISKRQLNLQSFDELRNTMVHEAAHILECNHDDNFSKENFINNLFVGELSIEVFISERGKEREVKIHEAIKTMVVTAQSTFLVIESGMLFHIQNLFGWVFLRVVFSHPHFKHFTRSLSTCRAYPTANNSSSFSLQIAWAGLEPAFSGILKVAQSTGLLSYPL